MSDRGAEGAGAARRWPGWWPAAPPGVDPRVMGIGPVPATQKALARGRAGRVGRPRPGRAQRGLRRAVAGVLRELELDPAQGQRQRRRHRARPPARLQRARASSPPCSHEMRAAARGGAWPPCASASARASRCSSRAPDGTKPEKRACPWPPLPGTLRAVTIDQAVPARAETHAAHLPPGRGGTGAGEHAGGVPPGGRSLPDRHAGSGRAADPRRRGGGLSRRHHRPLLRAESSKSPPPTSAKCSSSTPGIASPRTAAPPSRSAGAASASPRSRRRSAPSRT